MVILGIDPGYAIVGYGCIDYRGGAYRVLGYGAITNPAGQPFPARLQTIYRDMDFLMKKYSPPVMSIEELFFTNNQTTGIAVAQARGVILLSAMENEVEVAEYTPLQVKQSVVGYGRAEKKQVMEMTRSLLKLREVPKPDDTAVALALTICHAHASGSQLRSIRAGL